MRVTKEDRAARKERRSQERQERQEQKRQELEQKKQARRDAKEHQKEMRRGKVTHALGAGSGGITLYPDGQVEYRRTLEVMPSFSVNIRDVTGFSTRRVTRADKERWKNAGLTQVFIVQGSGTTLAEVPVNYGTAKKIEEWFRSQPDFGANAQQRAAAPAASVADELTKFAALRDSGVLTEEEFAAQKERLLGQ